MNIAAAARDATADFIDAEGEDVTLTEPDATEHTIKGLVIRADKKFDADARVRFYEPFTEVTVSVKTLGKEPVEGWQCEITDAGGNTVSGYIMSPEYDRTRDCVTAYIEVQQ
jgi:hypothetical protein